MSEESGRMQRWTFALTIHGLERLAVNGCEDKGEELLYSEAQAPEKLSILPLSRSPIREIRSICKGQGGAVG